MTQAAQFWDKVADKYSKQPIADEAAYQQKLAVTRNYFRPDMEVLEIGCGTGSNGHPPCPLCEAYPRHRFLCQYDCDRPG